MPQALCGICGEPMPPGEHMFNFHGYSGDCPKPPQPKKPNIVSFTREPNGDVRVTITSPDGTVVAAAVVNKHHWISDVLNATTHGERPGDYHAWLSHHDGEKDILEGRRGGY